MGGFYKTNQCFFSAKILQNFDNQRFFPQPPFSPLVLNCKFKKILFLFLGFLGATFFKAFILFENLEFLFYMFFGIFHASEQEKKIF